MPLRHLDMNNVFAQYQLRETTHREILTYFNAKNIESYVNLSLGIERPEGNYSAYEHGLGPRILNESPQSVIFGLAEQLNQLDSVHNVPDRIYRANIPYLKISVGSEVGMMLRPDAFWVGNVRTIWSHLLIRHNFNYNLANEELELYNEPDGSRPSEMEYQIWRDLYLALENSLERLIVLGNEEASRQSVQVGEYKYLWADAICNELYENA